MPTNKIPKEVEEAIKEMPEREKDKLLLRLIRKDELLIRKLEYELLGDESDMVFAREEIKEGITGVYTMSYAGIEQLFSQTV